jgi:hypothetical protein
MSEEIKFQTLIVDLPSKGKLYPPENPLSTGEVELKYGSAIEENILLNDYFISKKIVFDKLLESLIINKSINTDDLFGGDRNCLLIHARRAMYGDEYKAKIVCPNCKEKHEITVDLSTLVPYPIDDNIESNSFIHKSKSGDVFTYHILNSKEEKTLNDSIKNYHKKTMNNSQDLTVRLSAMIDSINDIKDEMGKRNFINSMSSIDILSLRKEIIQNTPDIDMRIDFACSECDFEDKATIPIDLDFFWITGR